jgi:hypothetical protein
VNKVGNPDEVKHTNKTKNAPEVLNCVHYLQTHGGRQFQTLLTEKLQLKPINVELILK